MAPIQWDGGSTVGPVRLGMTQDELVAALPGHEVVVDEEDDQEAPSLFWESDELGLSVQICDGQVASIVSEREFALDGVNLVGLAEADAIERAQGETWREKGDVDIVETGSGLVLWVDGGVVTGVEVSDPDTVASYSEALTTS